MVNIKTIILDTIIEMKIHWNIIIISDMTGLTRNLDFYSINFKKQKCVGELLDEISVEKYW